mmetsp:Transcript_59902/g.122944  ORF Transcript_59902/g.122944 Transcript_59902/m.122944 type:complete len:231 (+) Transcript_59902:672-1364(+)
MDSSSPPNPSIALGTNDGPAEAPASPSRTPQNPPQQMAWSRHPSQWSEDGAAHMGSTSADTASVHSRMYDSTSSWHSSGVSTLSSRASSPRLYTAAGVSRKTELLQKGSQVVKACAISHKYGFRTVQSSDAMFAWPPRGFTNAQFPIVGPPLAHTVVSVAASVCPSCHLHVCAVFFKPTHAPSGGAMPASKCMFSVLLPNTARSPLNVVLQYVSASAHVAGTSRMRKVLP